MGPPWPRLALRSLVRGGPAGPGCGLGWPRQEWPGVAKPLIQLHLVAFRCFPVVYAGTRGAFRSGQPLIQSHLVSFRLIPLVDWGRGFTLILAFSPQGRRDLTAFAGTTGVGGATAGSGLSRWDGDRLRWCTLATPGIGPGRSRPRHACRNLGGVCKWVTHAGGRSRGLAAALESSYSLFGIPATVNCRDDAACCVWRSGLGGGCLVWEYVGGGVTFGRFANRPYTQAG